MPRKRNRIHGEWEEGRTKTYIYMRGETSTAASCFHYCTKTRVAASLVDLRQGLPPASLDKGRTREMDLQYD